MRRALSVVLGIGLLTGGCAGLNNQSLVVTDTLRQACPGWTDTEIIEELADVQSDKELWYTRAEATSSALWECDANDEACRICMLAVVEAIY